MFTAANGWKLQVYEPWEGLAPLAREAGFEGLEVQVDLDVPAEQYRRVLDAHGLRMAGTMLMQDWWGGDDARQAWAMERLPTLARHAAAAGATRFFTWILPYSDDRPWRDNFTFHVARLRPMAAVLAEHGCTLALEFLGPHTLRVGHRHSFIHSLEPMVQLAEAVGDNAGILLDSWHWHCSLGTVSDIESLDRRLVQYVHVNDAPAGLPIEQLIDLERRLPASTGVIDIGGFLGALQRIGYDGPVVPEPFDDCLKAMTPRDAMMASGQAMRRMTSQRPHEPLPEAMTAVSVGDQQAQVILAPTPRPRGHEVVVRLRAAMICGSNLHAFRSEGQKLDVGHEGAGVVAAVAHSTRLRVGDRVALAPLNACGRCTSCRRGDVILCDNRPPVGGTFAEYVRIADHMCVKLPDEVTFERGALLGCGLGPAYAALRAVEARAYDAVLVSGLGPVGLGATALATFLNARVIGIDPQPYRRELAMKLGAVATFAGDEPDLHLRVGEAANGCVSKVVECSGHPEAQRRAIDIAAPLGRVAFVGENWSNIPLNPSNDMIRKQLTLRGVWHMNMNDADDLVTFLRREPEKADLLITHRFPLAEAQRGFEVFTSRQAVKVVLEV